MHLVLLAEAAEEREVGADDQRRVLVLVTLGDPDVEVGAARGTALEHQRARQRLPSVLEGVREVELLHAVMPVDVDADEAPVVHRRERRYPVQAVEVGAHLRGLKRHARDRPPVLTVQRLAPHAGVTAEDIEKFLFCSRAGAWTRRPQARRRTENLRDPADRVPEPVPAARVHDDTGAARNPDGPPQHPRILRVVVVRVSRQKPRRKGEVER
jgi:hypothetical protein